MELLWRLTQSVEHVIALVVSPAQCAALILHLHAQLKLVSTGTAQWRRRAMLSTAACFTHLKALPAATACLHKAWRASPMRDVAPKRGGCCWKLAAAAAARAFGRRGRAGGGGDEKGVGCRHHCTLRSPKGAGAALSRGAAAHWAGLRLELQGALLHAIQEGQG